MTRRRPILVDLFCGAGGCTRGYQQVGFHVIGVDIQPQPHYCGDEFVQLDAIEYVQRYNDVADAWHASPPCQGYSRMRHLPWLQNREYPLLIAPIRQALETTGRPWVIENVNGAPLNGAELCGMALGLPIIRHRKFESNILLLFPPCPGHPVLYAGSRTMRQRGRGAGVMGLADGARPSEAMGIDWMTQRELRQAIPPAYTRFVGAQIMAVLGLAS